MTTGGITSNNIRQQYTTISHKSQSRIFVTLYELQLYFNYILIWHSADGTTWSVVNLIQNVSIEDCKGSTAEQKKIDWQCSEKAG